MEKIVDRLAAVQLSSQAEELKVLAARQASLKFKLPIMGGMKAGKSTMLARMLGVDEMMFPKDVVEATAKNVNIQYGPLPFRSYTTSDGQENAVSDNVLWNALVCGKSDVKFSRLDIALPDSLLQQDDIAFVDTPGNNTVDDYKATETWNALIDSQAGIYCLKATALVEGSDLKFLQEAKYYVNDFFFVVTRLDEAGARSVHSDLAKLLVESAKKKLFDLGIKPLAVLPISATAPQMEDTGIPELRQEIQKVIRAQGSRLKNHQIWEQGTRLLANVQMELSNSLKLADKVENTSEEKFAEEKGALEGRLIELEGEKKNALRRLADRLSVLEQRTYKELGNLSALSLEKVENRLNQLQTYSAAKEFGDSIVRSELDKWRQDAEEVLTQLPKKVSEMQVEVSQDFVTQLQTSIKETIGIELAVPVAEIPEDLSQKTYADECLEDIERQRASLLQDISQLQEEIKSSGEIMPELAQRLAETQKAVQELHYEPVYDQVERPRTGGSAAFLKTLGGLADVAMIFLPTGWVTGIAKVGASASKLPKIANILKKGSKVAGTGKLLTAAGNVGKTNKTRNPLEFLSLEYWGEKLGNMIDGASGQRPEVEMVENQEVLAAFLQQKDALENQQQEARKSVLMLESKITEKTRTMELLEKQNLQLGSEYEKLQEEAKMARIELRNNREKQELAKWKQETLTKLNLLLFGKQSPLLVPAYNAVATFFQTCSQEASQELANRLEQTVAQVKEQLAQSTSLYSQEKTKLLNEKQTLKNQLHCLEEILNSNESDWFIA